jgi:hypothetical protein
MSLELLIGVPHAGQEVARLTYKIINENYPNGPESLMLELPPWYSENQSTCFGVPFFFAFEKVYKDKGTRIVYGDSCRAVPSERLRKIQRKDYTFKDYFSYLNYVMKELASAVINPWFLRKREKAMLEVIERENPQVGLVGRYHADYIKKKMPGVRYVALVLPNRNILFKAINYFFGPSNADEEVDIPI